MNDGSRRIRVLHLIDSLELGGAQTVLLNWLRFRDSNKFDVHLASMHGTPQSLFYQRASELQIRVVLLSSRRFWPLYLVRLPLEIVRGHYDVVHCHLFASNWIGKPLARFLGVPVVISHDQCNDAFRTRSALVTFIDRLANRFADRIFAVSRSIQAYLIAFEKIAPEKILVIPNGVPEPRPIERPRGTGKVVGGAGRFVPQKNFGRFLRIARILTDLDPSYEFLIAGGGPLSNSLKTTAARLGLRVEWTGVQSSLERFFERIDLYLLTSDFEGLPMVLLEALRHGIPAAAMAVDGVREEFANEILLLDPKATDRELAEHIHALLQNPGELAAFIQRGRAIVRSRFSARNQIRQIERIYLELLHGK